MVLTPVKGKCDIVLLGKRTCGSCPFMNERPGSCLLYPSGVDDRGTVRDSRQEWPVKRGERNEPHRDRIVIFVAFGLNVDVRVVNQRDVDEVRQHWVHHNKIEIRRWDVLIRPNDKFPHLVEVPVVDSVTNEGNDHLSYLMNTEYAEPLIPRDPRTEMAPVRYERHFFRDSNCLKSSLVWSSNFMTSFSSTVTREAVRSSMRMRTSWSRLLLVAATGDHSQQLRLWSPRHVLSQGEEVAVGECEGKALDETVEPFVLFVF